MDRELLLVDGEGLRLVPRDGTPVELRQGESHRFAGEQEIVGEPTGGPTRQLNLMWRRDRLTARLVLRPAEGEEADVHVLDDGLLLAVFRLRPGAWPR